MSLWLRCKGCCDVSWGIGGPTFKHCNHRARIRMRITTLARGGDQVSLRSVWPRPGVMIVCCIGWEQSSFHKCSEDLLWSRRRAGCRDVTERRHRCHRCPQRARGLGPSNASHIQASSGSNFLWRPMGTLNVQRMQVLESDTCLRSDSGSGTYWLCDPGPVQPH